MTIIYQSINHTPLLHVIVIFIKKTHLCYMHCFQLADFVNRFSSFLFIVFISSFICAFISFFIQFLLVSVFPAYQLIHVIFHRMLLFYFFFHFFFFFISIQYFPAIFFSFSFILPIFIHLLSTVSVFTFFVFVSIAFIF